MPDSIKRLFHPGRTCAVLVGLALSAFIGLVGEYAANRLGYEPAATHLPLVFLLPFLILILIPNIFLRLVLPSVSLNRTELIVIFSMGLAASMVPDQAMTKYLIVVISAPYYFASPENRWGELFFPYLPDWLVLSDRAAARLFYEGLSIGQPVPWSAWFAPLFWWGTIIAALMFVGFCIMVILRKQWMEYDRLQFPLARVGLQLIETDVSSERSGAQAGMFKAGFLLMSGIMAWNILSFWGQWPPVPIMGEHSALITFDPAFPGVQIRLNVFVFCLSFFVNREMLLSVWVFLLLYTFEEGLLNSFGVGSTSGTIVHGGLVGLQSIAGLITFVLVGLWMARRHLKDVLNKAMNRPSSLEDEDELFSYRVAVFGLILGMVYIIGWLHTAGMSFSVMIPFLFLLFVIYLSLARVVAEAGLVSVDLPINSHQFTIALLGSSSISRSNLTVFGLCNGFARNWRTFTMIGPSHIAFLRNMIPLRAVQKAQESDKEASSDETAGFMKGLFGWVALAFGASAAMSIGYVIHAGYRYGAQNLRTDLGTGRGEAFYGLIPSWINNATQVSGMEAFFFFSGVAVMLLLMAMRYMIVWWPLHPIGMVVVMSAPVRKDFLAVFLAWLIQTLLLRLGGGSLYRRVQPFFIGMLISYLAGQLVAMMVDMLWFPDRPHQWEVY